jgi:actin-related protein 6
VNVGGKLLTNYLKEVISYRQWNMMDEFKLMDQVKEDLCYVSTDFMNEFKQSKLLRSQAKDYNGSKLKKYFVLPDFHTVMKGFVKPDDEAMRPNDEQLLTMETERFSIPEVLFHPSDIGLHMAGIPEACQQSMQRLQPVSLVSSLLLIVSHIMMISRYAD